jgi:hypothetical protein
MISHGLCSVTSGDYRETLTELFWLHITFAGHPLPSAGSPCSGLLEGLRLDHQREGMVGDADLWPRNRNKKN